jgi:hypothetical protein
MLKESRNAGTGGQRVILLAGRCGVNASLKEEVAAILRV